MSDASVVTDTIRGERLHPLFLLTGLGNVVRGAWGIAAGGAYFAFRGNLGLAILLLGGFTALSVMGLLIKWLTFRFYLDRDELRVDQGLLSRSSRAIPFDRVTDVDIEQGPLQRLLGLARVRMETGASTSAAEQEGTLDTVSLERAEAIREYVRARRRLHGEPIGGHVPGATADHPPLFAMDSRRVLIAGLFNFSLAVLAVLFGASQTIGDVIGFDPLSRRFWASVLAQSGPLQDYVLAHRAISILAGSIVLAAIGVGTGLVRTVLREYRFRLDRTESGLRRRRGLLTLTDVTIPARRIQAAILASGPIRRAFGWHTLKMQSLASDGGDGSHVVAPLANEKEAELIQQSLGRPLSPDAHSWRGLPIGYVTSMAYPFGLFALLAGLASLLVGPAALLIVAGCGTAVAIRWADWHQSRYALNEGYLFIDHGWWRQRRAIIPVARMQSLDLTENLWTRLFGFSRMKLGVAGGSLLSPFVIPAICRDDALALRDRLLAR